MRNTKSNSKMPLSTLLRNLVKEEGCTYIHGYQEREDSRTFRIQSCWKSQQAFDAHLNTAHVKEFGELTKGMHDEPTENYVTDRIT